MVRAVTSFVAARYLRWLPGPPLDQPGHPRGGRLPRRGGASPAIPRACRGRWEGCPSTPTSCCTIWGRHLTTGWCRVMLEDVTGAPRPCGDLGARPRFLHDGRARTVRAAILAHGARRSLQPRASAPCPRRSAKPCWPSSILSGAGDARRPRRTLQMKLRPFGGPRLSSPGADPQRRVPGVPGATRAEYRHEDDNWEYHLYFKTRLVAENERRRRGGDRRDPPHALPVATPHSTSSPLASIRRTSARASAAPCTEAARAPAPAPGGARTGRGQGKHVRQRGLPAATRVRRGAALLGVASRPPACDESVLAGSEARVAGSRDRIVTLEQERRRRLGPEGSPSNT